MAYQTIRTAPEPVTPDRLTAGERAVLFNIETHTNWSDSGVVNALFEKGSYAAPAATSPLRIKVAPHWMG